MNRDHFFSILFNNSVITSFRESTLSSNLRARSFSYVSRLTDICGYFFSLWRLITDNINNYDKYIISRHSRLSIYLNRGGL